MKSFALVILTSFFLILGHSLALGGDLDDGITKFTDDGIGAYSDMGKPERNIKFIIRDAKAKAAVAKKNQSLGKDNGDSNTFGSSDGDSNVNSVVMGPGGSAKNITIINEK